MNARGATSSVDFLRKLREGYDVVMGNRFKGGIMPGAMPSRTAGLGILCSAASATSFIARRYLTSIPGYVDSRGGHHRNC